MALRHCLRAPLLLLLLTSAGPASAQQRVNPDASAIADFKQRIDDYVGLHKKLEATLPSLPKQTNPTEVDQNQRGLAKLMQQERKNAKQGDIFTPAMQTLVRKLLRPIFRGVSGRQIKEEILDNEYKGNVSITVNGRYPDTVPLSTVPPQVLQALPPLPEDLQYRFVRRTLILLDPHAHMIVDYVERAFE